MWIKQDARLNFSRLDYIPNPNTFRLGKMSGLTFLGLARHKRLWVWQDARLNSLGLGYVLDLVAFVPRGMLDLISLGYYLPMP